MTFDKRTEILIGKENIARLNNSHVAVFGLGGVGSFAAEALARASIGKLTLIDFDTVDITNINRQSIAFKSTVGQKKTTAAMQKIVDINPDIELKLIDSFFEQVTLNHFDFNSFDVVIDAIDSVGSKVLLIKTCIDNSTTIFSSMGAGGKTDPSKIKIDDLFKTTVCPLARIIRKELKKLQVSSNITVVYSTESPVKPHKVSEGQLTRQQSDAYKLLKPQQGSISFIPSIFGLMLSGLAVNSICK